MRFNEREAFRTRQGYTKYEVSVPGIEIFVNYELNTAAMFGGKRSKADWKYRFNDQFKMIQYVEDRIKDKYDVIQAKELQKAQDKIMAKENRAKVQVGDVFYTSWGYEQTNVDFFQVTKRVSATRVEIKAIDATLKEDGFMSGRKTPHPNHFIGNSKVVTINKYGNLSKADRYGNSAYKSENPTDSRYVSWGY